MSTSYSISLNEGYILAAEDSKVQAKKLKFLLDGNNINNVIFDNGEDALNAAIMKKPVLIISDIIMPKMDGYTLCSRVKTNPELKDVPVILLTSLSDPMDIIKGLQAGADNFITKPYEDQYLLSRIKYLLANRDIRRAGMGDMSMEVVFQNEKFLINSDKKQILDLLLSVYEAAIHRNEQLIMAQRQLQVLNESLQTANQELDAFAHTVSHDLRSPLNGVMGFANILLDDYDEFLDDYGKECLKFMMQSVSNMAQLIEDLLQFSRSGRTEINPDLFNISLLAEKVLAEIKMREPDRKVQVIIEPDINIHADNGLMRVVLNNLLGNAWKYSQKNPQAVIKFGSYDANGQTVYFVEDNGAGFDMEKASKLFSPFIRLHSNEEFNGTGVGLSTVKRIVERHGGSIWAESEPGHGARFMFTLKN